jgi:TolA-binding protein
MTKATSKGRRFWLPLVILALAVALALGGCARGAQNTGATGSQSTTGASQPTSVSTQPGTGSTNDELNQLQQVDQQTQNDLNTLNNDEQNANQNTGSDQEVVP